MKATEAILKNHIAGYVAMMMVIIFGGVALGKLAIQLTPEVEEPEISVTTTWRAASPEEVESEIIEQQEDALKGIAGVVKMLSEAREGSGVVRLTFAAGTDSTRALIDVVNRLNNVTDYPEDAEEPVLSNVGERSRPIAWFIIRPAPGNTADILSYRRYIEEVVQSRFERVNGVALSEVRGTMPTEVRISIDPYKAAGLGVLIPETAQRLNNQDDISGGNVEIGKRDYNVRFRGAYSVRELSDMVLAWRDGKPVRLGDVADISLRPADKNTFVITKEGKSIAVNAYRETGVNVLRVMSDLQAVAQGLAEGPLRRKGLTMEQVYDETTYISDAIQLLFGNLAFGILLATGMLYWFTRKIKATMVVGMSIPISLFAAFIVLQLADRTLNTISLAAMALSVGMILDTSIIMVENILRLRATGLSMYESSLRGMTQIRDALVASTVTTVAVFFPIVLMEDEAGQLFADLAIGLSTAIIVSLLTALFLTPSFSNRWLRKEEISDPFTHTWRKMTTRIIGWTDTSRRRGAIIAVLFSLPIVLTFFLLPRADYLPAGSRNLVFAVLLPPPGMNVPTLEEEVGQVLARRMRPHVKEGKFPEIKHYFFVAFPSGAFMGARAKNPEEVGALVPLLNGMMSDFPGMLAFARRASLFSRGDTRTVEMNIQGNDIGQILEIAARAYGTILATIPGARVQPRPGLELASPQLALIPDEDRIAEVGWERSRVGLLARTAGDGLFVTDYFDGTEKVDVIARMEGWESPEELLALPIYTPDAGIVSMGELVDAVRSAGPESIRRVDRRRTLSLDVIAPPNLSLQEMLVLLREKVAPTLEDSLRGENQITYTGGASKLSVALSNMSEAFALAIVILFLLMAVLFRSFKDSLMVVLALPLALVGSVLMLRLVGLLAFQPMDLLTMLGFVVMLGLVVNNAILLVHQTRAAERDGLPRQVAVEQALLLRLRPIFMSTLTSLLGMLPLLLNIGSGTELYRGMAAVIVGGLSVSTLFTLILLPALLRLGEGKTREAGTGAPHPESAGTDGAAGVGGTGVVSGVDGTGGMASTAGADGAGAGTGGVSGSGGTGGAGATTASSERSQ